MVGGAIGKVAGVGPLWKATIGGMGGDMLELFDRAASLYITLYDALIVPGLIVGVIVTIWFWNYMFY